MVLGQLLDFSVLQYCASVMVPTSLGCSEDHVSEPTQEPLEQGPTHVVSTV